MQARRERSDEIPARFFECDRRRRRSQERTSGRAARQRCTGGTQSALVRTTYFYGSLELEQNGLLEEDLAGFDTQIADFVFLQHDRFPRPVSAH